MRHTLVTFASICTLALAAPALAQERPANQNIINGYVGVGVLAVPDYEGSEDHQAVPLLSARLQHENYYLETRGLGLRANVSSSDRIEFGPVFKYNMGRDDDVDNNVIASLREIDDAFEAGAFVKVPYPGVFDPTDELALELTVLTDISSTYDGTIATFGPSYSRMISPRLRLGSSLSTTYATENYMDTYFSVDANNALRSGLNQFEAEGGFKDVNFGIMANYQLNEKWGVIGLINYKYLLGDAADSPIVDQEGSEGQFMFGSGVTYRF